MSEESTAVAAPAVIEAAPAPSPVVVEAPAVTTATPEPPKVAPAVVSTKDGPPMPPRSVRQMAKTSAMEKAAKAADAFAEASRTPGKVDERGRTHATEDGTYLEDGAAEVAPGAPAVEGAAAKVAEPVSDGTPPAAKAAGPEFVTIKLDPSSPLADQGVSELTVPASIERHIRTLVNAAVRQRDVQESKSALEQAHLDNARLQARVMALSEGTPEADPLEAEMLAQIKEHYPEKAADIEAALKAKRDAATTQKESEIYDGIQREHVSKVFMHDVFTTSPQKYPLWSESGELQSRMSGAMAQYGDYIDARNLNLARVGEPQSQPSTQEFYQWVDTQYIRDPRVQEQIKRFRSGQQEKSRAAIAAEERQKLAAQERATLAAAAERHAGRPPSTPGIPSQGTTPLPTEEGAGRSHGNRAKAIKQGIRERYSTPA